MMVMTAKVDLRKIMIALAIVAGVILAVVLLFGNRESEATPTANLSSNDTRVQFLQSQGWEVTTSPTQSGQVRIPTDASEVFDRYNALQKSQGYDLSQYAGKTVMRYVYQVNNYPDATEPVYATVLVYKNQVIGGDITDTSATGAIRGFAAPKNVPAETTPSAPTEESIPPTE